MKKRKFPKSYHLPVEIFHHRYYRYVRMMLRRYPKMRGELLSWSVGPGIDGICQSNVDKRLRDALARQPRSANVQPRGAPQHHHRPVNRS